MEMKNPRTGIRMNYHDTNAGGRPAVILTHGLSGNYTRWGGVAALISGKYRVVDYDLRGHGMSDKGAELDYSFDAHVEDLAGLMDFLGLQSAVIAGHSMGGMIAQHFTLKYPDRVEKMVLAATAACVIPGKVKKGGAAAAAWFLSHAPSVMNSIVQKKIRSKPAELFPELNNPELAAEPRAVAHCLKGIMRLDIRDEVREVNIPTLVMSSSIDELVAPVRVRELADLIPGAKFVEIENQSHYLPLEQPEKVAAAMIEFIG